jgi:hypothetical protein
MATLVTSTCKFVCHFRDAEGGPQHIVYGMGGVFMTGIYPMSIADAGACADYLRAYGKIDVQIGMELEDV